tara:strand:- start:954 stop:1547 length:594 start_codon:yes stop_codon:yes gene_type:complete
MVILKQEEQTENRYAVFNSDTGELLSVLNYKPENCSFIEVDPLEVTGLLSGEDQMSYYYVHYSKITKKYELRLRINNNIDSYSVNDLIYEIPKDTIDNADLSITQNIKDTCWKIQIGGDLKANILAQHISLHNKVSLSVTRKNDPNILYKTLHVDFSSLENNKYIILPFTDKFEFEGEEVSIYTMKKFDQYSYGVIQ